MRVAPILGELAAASPFELNWLRDDEGVLTISLAAAGHRSVALAFDEYLSYRKRNEGDALSLLSDLGKADLAARWFYEAEDSEFLAWFHRESFGVRAQQRLRHYIVAAQNDVIEVVSPTPPRVTVSD